MTKIEQFNSRLSCHIRLTNTTGTLISGIWIWCVYTPNSSPGTKDVLLANADIKPYESVAIAAGPFNFPDNGSLWAMCGTANALAIHINKAAY
jgi:hypothetical protein